MSCILINVHTSYNIKCKCGFSVLVSHVSSGSKLAMAKIHADDIMHISMNVILESNSDYTDIYNLPVALLELPISDVFLKVHIYLHRALYISVCLYCSPLDYMYLHVKKSSYEFLGRCLLTFVVFSRFVSDCGAIDYRKKKKRELSPLAQTNTQTLTHKSLM